VHYKSIKFFYLSTRNYFSIGIGMLWAVISLLFLLWLIGVILKISLGGLLHVVLIIAVILLVINLLKTTKHNYS